RNYPDKDVLSDITTMDPSIAWTGGAMISNAYDLNRWVREVYKGTLLNDELQKERLTFRDMGNNLSYGLAVMKLGNFYGHNGTILGYNTVMLYLPQKDATIIAIINHMNDAEGDSQPAMEMFGKTAKILYPNDAGF
ncbi:MAG: serine hydrolase, partial [Proteobacteria bacterium]|nr:serine hydrolase [Pseudomonadota bacterium]